MKQRTKLRAIGSDDKEERRQAILDAAERLLMKHPERMAAVSEVAAAAGLAKGTVYLYFPSKEEMLLALHERNVGGFFQALIALLEGKAPVDFGRILALTHEHMVDAPLFLPLASRCFGLMAQSIPDEAAIAFKQRMADRAEGPDRACPGWQVEVHPKRGRTMVRDGHEPSP